MSLEPITLTSTSAEYTRDAWLLEPAPGSHATRLCVFLDAEFYLNRMDAASTVLRLIEQQSIPPLTSVFVSHRDGEARQRDYICNPQYAEFIASDVVGWARARFPTFGVGGHVICGLSLSGLASAHIALTHPQIFAAAVCQSPSFWWDDENFSRKIANTPSSRTAYWISVGDKETETGVTHPPTGLRQRVSQITACNRAVEALRITSHTVRYHVFDGAHDTQPWQAELPDALLWALAHA